MSDAAHPYPPCYTEGGCNDRDCCAHGVKGTFTVSWPETVGMPTTPALNLINKSNPLVTVIALPKGSAVSPDFCCNRVYVFIDTNGNVCATPQVG
ncbi:hypothetical protein QN277_010205 [Acacia crassicarpa]|uniref:Uncharacterized protein n=1 Tax=Acacia crassicarpa TaxID=499986 RepID=A0AAE1INL1_9FABA|nr:hypothetical protein QN277_010205 [Acacia crassicarpa]